MRELRTALAALDREIDRALDARDSAAFHARTGDRTEVLLRLAILGTNTRPHATP